MHNPKRLKDLLIPINRSADSLFITCVSYEERSTLSARSLSSKYQADFAVIFSAIEFKHVGKTPRYFQEIVKTIQSRCKRKLEPFFFRMGNPFDLLHGFQKILKDSLVTDPLRAVTLDITTFPRQVLLPLLRFIDDHPQRGKIRLLYGEPKKYATEEKNQDYRWLTRGVLSVKSIPHFGGVQFPGRPKLLAIILGHEGERTHISLRRHQPDKLILIPQGKQQHHKGLREIADRENRQIISIYGSDSIWKRGLPSRGVAEAERIVGEIYEKYRYTHNIFLAANGTKLQLMGAYLACRRIPEIQITYAVPAVYNWQKYSTGTGRLSEMILEPPERFDQSN